MGWTASGFCFWFNYPILTLFPPSESFNGTASAPAFVFGGAISHTPGSSTTTGATTTETGTASHTDAGDAATTKPNNAGLALQPLVGKVLGALGVVALGVL